MNCAICEKKLNPNNTIGFCRDHRRGYIVKKHCGVCNKMLRADNNIGFCRQHRSGVEDSHCINKTSIIDYLGCSYPDLQKHLELMFLEGMTWDNYGTWQIDHIYPLSKVDLTDEDQIKKVCHYKNLQPLWAKDNKLKSDKIDYNIPTSVRHPKRRKQG